MVWFVYQKSPLGTVIRVNRKAIVDFALREDEEQVVNALCEHVSARLESVDVCNIDGEYEVLNLDPDVADFIRVCREDKRLRALVAVWS